MFTSPVDVRLMSRTCPGLLKELKKIGVDAPQFKMLIEALIFGFCTR